MVWEVNCVAMKKYLLLRDNQESGPYSLEELDALGLRSLDLIWIESYSTAWEYAKEMDALKDLVRETEGVPNSPHPAGKIFVSLPPNFYDKRGPESARNYEHLPVHHMEPVLETHYHTELDPLPERDNTALASKNTWHKKIFPDRNALKLAAVFLGLVIGAVMIKKTVDGSALPPDNTETAVATQVIEEPTETAGYEHALSVSSEPVAKPMVKPMKPKDIRKMISVKANDYKVGFFGGISDLKLTVSNSSPHFVNSIAVVVDYLKPNGDVIQSDQYEISSVRPNGSKSISVPPTSRGRKVKIRVVNIYSQAYKAALKQI